MVAMNDPNTTLIKRRADMRTGPIEACHDGEGSVDWVEVLGPADLTGRGMKFVHDDVLPPGASVGLHGHVDDEEYYYIVSGQGVMTLDDEQVEVQAGDITAVFPGGQHALRNTGSSDLRFIVICAKPSIQH